MNFMKTSLKKIKDCRVKLHIEVEADRVENRFQEVLKDFQRAAQLPGFRQGKAPLEMVERRYSKEAHEEVLKSLIPEAYHQAVQAEKVHPVALPAISEIQCERGKKLVFAAEFERAPETQVKNYKGIKLKREALEVDADELEKGMQSLIESRAELIPLVESRAVQKGDFVVTDVEIWQEDKYVPGKQGVLLYVEPSETDDFYDKILGTAQDDVREIHHKQSAEDKSKGEATKPHYKVWIRGIKEKKLPALNEEFAKTFGKDTVELLKETVKKDLAAHKHTQSLEKMKKELFEKLLSQNSFTVPEGLVEKQEERLFDQARRQYQQMGIPESKFVEERSKIEPEIKKRAEEQVRLYFILQKISEAESIELDEIELQKRLEGLAAESQRPMEEVRRVFEEDLRESMVEAKTVDFLVANAKFDEK